MAAPSMVFLAVKEALIADLGAPGQEVGGEHTRYMVKNKLVPLCKIVFGLRS